MSEKATGQEAVRYWWKMALESLESARREADAESLPFAINRLYYAAFYAVSAALLERNIAFNRHSAVRSALHSELIRSGELAKEWGRVYERLFEDRQGATTFPLPPFPQTMFRKRLQKPKPSSQPSTRLSVPCHNAH